jgi:hypothetical protein
MPNVSESPIIHVPPTCAKRTVAAVEKLWKTGPAGRSTVARICGFCGTDFRVSSGDVRRGKGRFCSVSCGAKNRATTTPRSGPANPNWRGGVSANHVRYVRRYMWRHPEKWAAKRKVQRAIRAGHLVRPSACSACGVSCRPHGHHDDYGKPLSVRWLCRECHRIADKQRFIHGPQWSSTLRKVG